MQTRPPVRRRSYILVYALLAFILLMAHAPLLQLPFFWDEAGQFIPQSLDLYTSGSLIPHSTTPNIHPPAVMAWLALVWHVVGYSIPATRIAMTLVAALGAMFAFLLAIELCRGAAGTPAFAAVALLCMSPLFYAQSIMAQLDMPAMCATVAALLLFLQNRFRTSAVACVVLVLIKETGVVAPLVFAGWLLAEKRAREAAWYAMPAVALALWLVYLHHATGNWFGDSEFARYNLSIAEDPLRILAALARRIYYLFIGGGHFIGTAVLIYAWRRMPMLRDRAWRVTAIFFVAHVLVISMVGGAVLERYLLPVMPLLYVAFGVSLQALLFQSRRLVVGALAVCLVAANFVFPPYPFPFENNLAWVSFTELEMEAGAAIEMYQGTIVTTFPVIQIFGDPRLGFVEKPREAREIPDFHPLTIDKMIGNPPDLMVVYSTEYDPLHLRDYQPVRWFLTRLYSWQPSLRPDEVADRLGMRVAREWNRRGLRMALLVKSGPPRLQL
jgi:hypothetical protein